MPKKKKTLKLKKLSDTRREVNIQHQKISITENKISIVGDVKIPAPVSKHQPISTQTISTNEYSYLSSDLYKTAMITSLIIIIEILLNFLTKGFSQ